jgi:hypothetical protein
MKNFLIPALVAALLATPAVASAFWGGTVINVAPTDTLKIRAWPASYSAIIDAEADGANLSLTGRCKNTVTNVSFRIDGGQSANWKYNKMKQPNVWCQIMTPSAQLGWARGRYIWPN